MDEYYAEHFRKAMIGDLAGLNFTSKNVFTKMANFVRILANTGSFRLSKLYYDINYMKYKGAIPTS